MQIVPCGLGDEQDPAGLDSALHLWLAALLDRLPAPANKCSDDPLPPIDGGSIVSFRPSFYGGGRAARLEMSFKHGAAAAQLTQQKQIRAVRALAAAAPLVLFAQVERKGREVESE